MNEFVEQFLLESRDLVAQATDDLMALEETPADHSYQVLVTHPHCQPRLYTVSQATVRASTPFALPPR